MNHACLICGSHSISIENQYTELCRVTSDSKPWKRGGEIGTCLSCGAVQKITSENWHNEIKNIYNNYNIYQLSNGNEQVVFDGASGANMSRSEVLIHSLCSEVQPVTSGRLLDIGCGNGAWLKVFSQHFPEWILSGTEWNDKNKKTVKSIRGVEELYTCSPEQVPDDFDLITMIHVLEHIFTPLEFLTKLRDKLKPSGILLIEVPNYLQNPFDLLIADHCLHYTEETLHKILNMAGYNIIFSSTDCVMKEITIIAKKDPEWDKAINFTPKKTNTMPIGGYINQLVNMRNMAKEVAEKKMFGIFGTGIAATWLVNELSNQIDFFVDEDPFRIGKEYMGKPIYSPNSIPKNTNVFIALPIKIASSLQKRLSKYKTDVNYLIYEDSI